ncbi:MAG: hypothetical protein ACE5M4_12990 [Anaerolineales bacterium]
MTWLFVLMAMASLVVFGLLPFWVGFGYFIAIAWCAGLLYSVFLPDPLSRGIDRASQVKAMGGDPGGEQQSTT